MMSGWTGLAGPPNTRIPNSPGNSRQEPPRTTLAVGRGVALETPFNRPSHPTNSSPATIWLLSPAGGGVFF